MDARRLKLRIWCPLVCLGLTLIAAVAPIHSDEAAPSPARKVFTESVIPLPESTAAPINGRTVAKATAQTAKQKVKFAIALTMPAKAKQELADRIAKGEVLTAKEIDEKYSPPAGDVEKLVKWLKAPEQSLTVLGQSKDRSSIYVQGTVPQIEKALQVQFVRVTQGGVTYTAVRNAPSLPIEYTSSVSGFLGLQPNRKATKKILPITVGNRAKGRKDNQSTAKFRPLLSAPPSPESPTAPSLPPYSVPEILKVYNADALGATGKGQTIAILIDTFPNKDDVTQFWADNGITGALPGQLEFINVTGGSLVAASGEETLDVEWSSGVAPGAKIRVYATQDLGWDNLNLGLDQIYADLDANPGLRQLSISLGLGETFNGRDVFDAQSEKFMKLAARGVSIFVSSGDAGSRPAQDGHSEGNVVQVEFGSSSPWVVGVGGTELRLNGSGGVAEENAWKFGGGGESRLYLRPSWQKGNGVPAVGMRLVPDVAAASLATEGQMGAYIVLNGSSGGTGGTSWSAPMWAGFSALINQKRVSAGKQPLPFMAPLLYPLNGTAAFRDIVTGDNIDFAAGPGYDKATGLGVPNVKELMNRLLLVP
jgi:kumamolisin